MAINEENFPDEIFRNEVESFDKNGDGVLSDEEIASVTSIDVNSRDITSLKGVEHFTALRGLYCNNNQLTEIDLSNNTALISLDCSSNQLTELDLSNNTVLKRMSYYNNQLISLDLSNNTALERLTCRDDKFLRSLNVSNNTSIRRIILSRNEALETINLSGCTALERFECWDCKVSELDLSDCTSLKVLYCLNMFNEFDMYTNNQVKKLDLSHNTALEELYCVGIPLEELDISKCTKLAVLWCFETKLASLDLSKSTALKDLNCGGFWSRSPLTELDVSNNTALETLNCVKSHLTELYVGNNTALTWLDCDKNHLTGLDVSGCTDLRVLLCEDNQLTMLDLSNNTALSSLHCRSNDLTALNLRHNKLLHGLDCRNNRITSLDLTDCHYLQSATVSCDEGVQVNYFHWTAPTITAISLDDAPTGSPYEVQLKADGTEPITWIPWPRGGMLPPGLTFSTSGLLSGTPTKAGTYKFTLTAENLGGSDSKRFELTVFTPTSPSISADEMINDVPMGIEYSLQFTAEGTNPITWTHTGTLPPGLTFSESGLLNGTPSESGTYTFTVKASNVYGEYSKDITMTVFTPIIPSITTDTVSDSLTGMEYSIQFKAEGTAPIKWTYTGRIPSGLTLSDSGLLNGTLTRAGKYTFTAKATNPYGEGSKDFVITVLNPKKPLITSDITYVLTAGTECSLQFTAEGTLPITWSCNDTLPPGLTLNESGLLSGTPTKSEQRNASYKFTIKASNAYGENSQQIHVFIVAPTKPTVSTLTLDTASTAKPYTFQLQASGAAPITWTCTGNLPKGLTLSDSGIISGIPTKAGKFTFTVTATNTQGSGTRDLTLQVCDSVSITTKNLKAATIRKSYTATLKAKGSKPLTWSAQGLPDGLTINSKTGKISGKPTVHGTFSIDITAQNSASLADETFTLMVKGLAPKLSGNLAKATLNTQYSSGLKLTAGSLPVTWSCTGTLPAGLTFDSETGTISGIPASYAKSGYNLTITASNDTGKTSKKVTMMVKGKQPAIKTSKLPNATAGEKYCAALTATGSEPFYWEAGFLPEGLTLSGDKIIGVPEEPAKSFKIKLTVTNPVGKKSRVLTLKINAKQNNTEVPVMAGIPESVNTVIDGGYEVVAELGEISCDESGMYDFGITLSDDVPQGAELLYMAGSDNPSDDDDIAEFYDDEGGEVSAVPESRRITVSVWLNKGTIYYPAIAILH